MEPTPILDEWVSPAHGERKVNMLPPNNDYSTGCEAVEVLMCPHPAFGVVRRIPYKLTEHDIAKLEDNPIIWLSIYGEAMPPVALYLDQDIEDDINAAIKKQVEEITKPPED